MSSFFLFLRSKIPISDHSIHDFTPFKVINNNNFPCFPKTLAKTLLPNFLWDWFTDYYSLVLLFIIFRCIIMDPCLIHIYKSTQKFIRILTVELNILIWNSFFTTFTQKFARAAAILPRASSYFFYDFRCCHFQRTS